MDDAIEDRGGQDGIADYLVPAVDRDLAGDQQRSAIAAFTQLLLSSRESRLASLGATP